MQRFLLDFAAFVLIHAALLGALFWQFHDGRKVSPFMPAVEIKHQRLATAPSPRMILIGGSNLLFGIDSKMIEAQTDFHPVNMGLMRGLRLDYILNEIDGELRAGDLVVMCVEYGTLNGDALGEEGQIIMSAMAGRIANVRHVSWAQRKELLDFGAMEYFGVAFRQAIKNISERDRPRRSRDILDAVNAYGDLTAYHDPVAVPRDQGDQTTLSRARLDGIAASVRRINESIERWRERGVRVMFSFPPICRSHYAEHADVAGKFQQLLSRDLHAPVICTPLDMTFDDAHFIGRSYHLQGEGVRVRTQRLIDAVHANLAATAGTADSDG